MKPGFLLTFNDTTGTKEPGAFFCTFRLGIAWEKKLKAEDWVYLGTKTTVYQQARVVRVTSGTAKKVIGENGMFHHLEQQQKRTMMVQRRLESLTRLYGPQKFNEDSTLTVIYLQNQEISE